MAAGIGNELRVFDIVSGRVLLEAQALPKGARLHGIHTVPGASTSEAILAIHGDSYVQVCPSVTLSPRLTFRRAVFVRGCLVS